MQKRVVPLKKWHRWFYIICGPPEFVVGLNGDFVFIDIKGVQVDFLFRFFVEPARIRPSGKYALGNQNHLPAIITDRGLENTKVPIVLNFHFLHFYRPFF